MYIVQFTKRNITVILEFFGFIKSENFVLTLYEDKVRMFETTSTIVNFNCSTTILTLKLSSIY